MAQTPKKSPATQASTYRSTTAPASSTSTSSSSQASKDGKIILILAWFYKRIYRFSRWLKRHKKVVVKLAVVVVGIVGLSGAYLIGKQQGVKQQKAATSAVLAAAQRSGSPASSRITLAGTVTNLTASNLEIKTSDNKKSTVEIAKSTITLDSKGKRLDVAKLTKNSKVSITASVKTDGTMLAQRIRQE